MQRRDNFVKILNILDTQGVYCAKNITINRRSTQKHL